MDDWDAFDDWAGSTVAPAKQFRDEEEEEEWLRAHGRSATAPVEESKPKLTKSSSAAAASKSSDSRARASAVRSAAVSTAVQDEPEFESDEQRKAWLKKKQIESDLQNVADLFGEASIGAKSRDQPNAQAIDQSLDLFAADSSDDDDTDDEFYKSQSNLKQQRRQRQTAVALETPQSKNQFDSLKNDLMNTLALAADSLHYAQFVQQLFVGLAKPMKLADVRVLSTKVSALVDEKAATENSAVNNRKQKPSGPMMSVAKGGRYRDTDLVDEIDALSDVDFM